VKLIVNTSKLYEISSQYAKDNAENSIEAFKKQMMMRLEYAFREGYERCWEDVCTFNNETQCVPLALETKSDDPGPSKD
jgi:hypothetical protein